MALRPIRRRTFLRTIVVTAGAATVAPSLIACDDGGGPSDPSTVFPQSLASGDPRADSIVLWTRAQPSALDTDAMVQLELATDEGFTTLITLSESALVAEAAHDHCLRVKVTGLSPSTRYFYRFEHAGTRTRTGRFKTAPAAGTDVPVRFALVSCQDYVGRYYNTLLKLLEAEQDDLDFVVHLGDYVYETTGDPSFMMSSPERLVTLTDTAGAIALTEDGQTFYAARSLDNYRELYRTYRSDPVLQQVHERFPFLVIWDDHEFSDDCWQDVATYTGGRQDERDTQRRKNSEQAFLEFQPIARELDGEGALEIDPATLFPSNQIFRDFRFGQHMHLVLSDYRSYRPDHPIPEEAYPGTVVMTEAEVRAVLARRETEGRLPAGVTAATAFETGGYGTYVDLTTPTYARHHQAALLLLAGAYEANGSSDPMGMADRALDGPVDAALLNMLIEAGRAMLPAELQDVALIDVADPALERGLSFYSLGKRSLFGSVGARYLVVARHYDLWAEHRAASGDVGDALGEAQRAFLTSAIAANEDASWTVYGSSVSFAPLLLDVSAFAAQLPEGFPAETFYLSVDQWDGFPVEKERLLREVLRPRNALVISGDIHASYVTDHGPDPEGRRAVEVTGPGISSGSFRSLLFGSAQQLESLRDNPTVEAVLNALDYLLQTARPNIVHSHSDVNGLALVAIDGTSMQTDLWELPPTIATESFYDRVMELAPLWAHARYRVGRTGGNNGPIETISL